MFGWGKTQESEPEVTFVVRFEGHGGQVLAEETVVERGEQWLDPTVLPYRYGPMKTLPGRDDGPICYPVHIEHETPTRRRVVYRQP